MTPLHSTTLSGITAAVRRHYLRPLSLEPATGDPARWEVRLEGRTEPLRTEVVLSGDVYTFQDAAPKRVPNWDREIENEKP